VNLPDSRVKAAQLGALLPLAIEAKVSAEG